MLSDLSSTGRRVSTLNSHLGTGVREPRPHPLDPLSEEEIRAASKACRDYAATLDLPPLRFSSVGAKEPNKHAVLAHLRGEGPPPPRHALCILLAPPKNCVIEALVDLDAGTAPAMLSWKEMEGVQCCLNIDDVVEAEALLKRNPAFLHYMRERYGVEDVDSVACDPWYSGFRYGVPEGRIFQFILYLRTSPDDNFYAHPLDTVVLYDFNTDTVKDFLCYGRQGGQAVPMRDYNFHRTLMEGPWRGGMKPLDVVQREGPSFSVDGNAVAWQHWSFRVGFSWREGLILYKLGYEDGGRVRPIAYRLAVSEIFVPYAEPRSPYQLKAAIDVLDYGLGFCANSLELGCDCLGHIKYFDAVLSNAKGEPQVIKKAVCMHEEDYGIAWKHMEYRNGHAEVRRLRRLVISQFATIANYDYGFYWYLYQDGTIQFEAKLTGIVSTGPLYPDEEATGEAQHGVLVAPGVVAHHHQHFFQARLDMSVDDPHGGKGLSVVEVEAEPMPLGPDNPHGIGFVTRETLLETEQQAQRMCAPERSRLWKVINPRVLHPATGKPMAWKLMPSTPSPPMLAHPTSTHAIRGAFATKHLWVTPYAEDEMNPAGDYPLHPDPSQNKTIADWTAQNRRVADADVVLWHTFGLTHVVRPEDFPVMPVEMIGFHLKPFAFFEQNLAVDLPPTRNAASRELITGGAGPGGAGVAGACCAAPSISGPAVAAAPAAGPEPRSKL